MLESADLDEYYVSGLDYESAYWDDVDLEDTFDLPPVLPPVRQGRPTGRIQGIHPPSRPSLALHRRRELSLKSDITINR